MPLSSILKFLTYLIVPAAKGDAGSMGCFAGGAGGMARSGGQVSQKRLSEVRYFFFGGDGRLIIAPTVFWRKKTAVRGGAFPHGTNQARSAGREGSPCVCPSNFLRAIQSKPMTSASFQKSFSLFPARGTPQSSAAKPTRAAQWTVHGPPR